MNRLLPLRLIILRCWIRNPFLFRCRLFPVLFVFVSFRLLLFVSFRLLSSPRLAPQIETAHNRNCFSVASFFGVSCILERNPSSKKIHFGGNSFSEKKKRPQPRRSSVSAIKLGSSYLHFRGAAFSSMLKGKWDLF